jgi:tetratricopeptide (TPR) repeat protein
MGKEEDALKDLQRIIQMYSDTRYAEHAYYYQGLIYYNINRFEKAKPLLKSYLERYPGGQFEESVLTILQKMNGQ